MAILYFVMNLINLYFTNQFNQQCLHKILMKKMIYWQFRNGFPSKTLRKVFKRNKCEGYNKSL